MEAEDGGHGFDLGSFWRGIPHTHTQCYVYNFAYEEVDLNVSINYLILKVKTS